MLEEREEQEEKDLPSELVGDLLMTWGKHNWFRFAEIITTSLFLFNIYITRNTGTGLLDGSGKQTRPNVKKKDFVKPARHGLCCSGGNYDIH